MSEFKNSFGQNIFRSKYAVSPAQTWAEKARHIVEDVCGRGIENRYAHPLMADDERKRLINYIRDFKFLPGGRYVYYAGRKARFYNNCFLLRAEEDTREEWASLTQRAMSCLMTGGGIGIDYSRLRPKGRLLSRTGGVASGPIPLMQGIDTIGSKVMQGGSRRSAIYASLNWQHEDASEFLVSKNWYDQPIGGALTKNGEPYSFGHLAEDDFNAYAPLRMTNVSLNYDDDWLRLGGNRALDKTFVKNVHQAMFNGEPGFSFNFGPKSDETLRNACTEVTSADDSDVCNLGSINMSAIDNLDEFRDVVALASKFLVCGTLRAELPYARIYEVREKNRRLGLGLMGVHAWLLKRGMKYECTPDLHAWLAVYQTESERAANEHCDRLFISQPVAYRAIAPTGTISILAGTTSGIEPLFAVAYKRRYLVNGTDWKYEYVVDITADQLIKEYSLDPDSIETASDLASDPERRIRFQADVQDYVDMGISSTLNLPAWGTASNNPDKVSDFAGIVAKYAPRLRGLTFYPDGSRGGQPLNVVPYKEAISNLGTVFEENANCKEGVCGL